MLRRGFRRVGKGVQLRIDRGEREVVADLLGQLEQFVSPPQDSSSEVDELSRLVDIAPTADRPTDPALLRLLPDAYADDTAASDDFRRFTERGLREQKADNARTALRTLQRGEEGKPLAMSRSEGQAWLLALNDLRLTLAVRLGVADDADDAARDPLYDWLTWLQATLVDALAP